MLLSPSMRLAFEPRVPCQQYERYTQVTFTTYRVQPHYHQEWQALAINADEQSAIDNADVITTSFLSAPGSWT
jgi:hypothetical protein